ncbi:sporulation protein YunB [Paenibacillus castaneae]|uniref:sporulation protein YunB n=1 Tax=Paenibacillus castaneae TaxID=474957 RepID=UPI001FB9436F|nr:sporulation protein YunB [Paenibacillus castaneae]NIK76320.1 sporulation protein YunB [Paenibacillus castaneae]
MAKWGRKGLRFRPFGSGRMRLFSGRSFSRVKTVSWGSRSGSSTTRSTPPKKWGTGTSASSIKWGARPSSSSSGKWGTRRSLLRFGSRAGIGNSSSMGSAWGARPVKPRFRRRTVILITLIIMMLFSIQSFVYVEKNLRPPLMNVAKIRVKQMATQAINKAITEQVANRTNSSDLIDWKMNSEGKISGFMLNYAEHMSITSQTINTVQSTLNAMKNIPEHIPIGHAFNSAIISSYGPRIPVKFEPVGVAKVDLNTRQSDAGINMILVEVYIRIIAEVTIIIPFDTEPEVVETDIPISYLLVVGDVPMYYYDNTGKPVGESAAQAPNISVPLGQGKGGGGVSSSTENSNDASSHAGTQNGPTAGATTEEGAKSNNHNGAENNTGHSANN